MRVPFFDYPAHFRDHEEEYVRTFREVMGRGAFILQRELEEFERQLAEFVGVKHAIGVADGTNAMILGLRALGIGHGDEVLFPSHTFVATYGAIEFAGAHGVACDVGPDGLLDPADVEKRITPRTRAIMVVQLNGLVADMDALSALARRHGLHLCEDSCQALGATHADRSAGTFGAFGAFSFYPAKTLGCFGDGGVLVTNDDRLAALVREMRDHGRRPDGTGLAWTIGTNARLDNLQAAILLVKLRHLPEAIERRRQIAERYVSGIADLPGIEFPWQHHAGSAPRFNTFQNFEILVDQRDTVRQRLLELGVQTAVQWGGTPVHRMPCYRRADELPNVDRYFSRCLMLPMNHFMTDEQVDYVVTAFRRAFEECRSAA